MCSGKLRVQVEPNEQPLAVEQEMLACGDFTLKILQESKCMYIFRSFKDCCQGISQEILMKGVLHL